MVKPEVVLENEAGSSNTLRWELSKTFNFLWDATKVAVLNTFCKCEGSKRPKVSLWENKADMVVSMRSTRLAASVADK